MQSLSLLLLTELVLWYIHIRGLTYSQHYRLHCVLDGSEDACSCVVARSRVKLFIVQVFWGVRDNCGGWNWYQHCPPCEIEEFHPQRMYGKVVLHGVGWCITTSPMLCTSPWGVPETPWAQGGPRSDTRDLWRHWWEGPSDPSVGEGPGVCNAPYPRRLGVTRVRPWALGSLWHPDSRMLKNTLIRGVS